MVDRLSDNFDWPEFASGDGVEVPEQYRENVRMLAFALEMLRLVVKKPVHINSGYRTRTHNMAVGGSAYSQHLFGRAGDLSVEGWSGERLAGVLECLIALDMIPEGGVGTYSNFVHYDVRGNRERWEG